VKRKSAIIQYNGQVDPDRILILFSLMRANSKLTHPKKVKWTELIFFHTFQFYKYEMYLVPGRKKYRIRV